MGILSSVFGEYLIFKIYSIVPRSSPEANDPRFREIPQTNTQDVTARNGYGGYQSIGFVAEEDGVPVAHCWFWYGDRYRERNLWPLAEGEAKLVRIETRPESRGRGIASDLIAYASARMAERGFTRLYARIWHSYKPSLKAFKKAGWSRVALLISVPLGGKHRRFIFGKRPNG